MLAQINPIAFKVFGLPIHWYALCIVSGIIVAVVLASNEAKKVGLSEDDIVDFIFWALPISIVGARAYYVAFEWSYYKNNLSEIVKIWNGGIAIYGGLIAGALVLVFFTRSRFISTWKFLDVAAPSVIIAQAIGRWGNFANHEAYGPDTTRAFLQSLHLPRFIIDNMYIGGIYRQPTFFYESLWNVIGFIFIIVLRKKLSLKEGEIALTYVLWYSFGRFFIEGLRTDSLMVFDLIRVSQLLSIVLFVGALILLVIRRKDAHIKLYQRKV